MPSAKLLPMALYVVIIWKQEFERTQPYVHCFAAVLEIDKLITTHQCAFEIVEAFDSHKNFKFPQFSATIGDLSHDTKISLEILRPLIHEGLAMSTQIATIIPVSHQIQINKKTQFGLLQSSINFPELCSVNAYILNSWTVKRFVNY